MYYIGIDPGMDGGLCWLAEDSKGKPRVISLNPMPDTESGIIRWVVNLGVKNIARICIEQVHAMPGNGVTGMFKFGINYGGLRMCLLAKDLAFDAVSPQKWQKTLGIPPKKSTEKPSQWKNRLKEFAKDLYPTQDGITLKTCDALLIAHYTWMIYS